MTTTRYTVTVDGLPEQLGAEGRMVFDWTADADTSTDDIEGQARMMAVDALFKVRHRVSGTVRLPWTYTRSRMMSCGTWSSVVCVCQAPSWTRPPTPALLVTPAPTVTSSPIRR